MKYSVCLEHAGPVEKHVDVDADSPEEAVAKARELGKKVALTLDLYPSFVGEKAVVDAEESYPIEVVGSCQTCKNGITSREIPGQPWNYTSASEHGGLLCFKCAQGKQGDGALQG